MKTRKVKIVDIPPKFMAEGGEGFEEIQAELGELFFMPDFQLVDTKAEEKHDDMDDHEVTDVLPSGSFVFSDTKKNLLDLRKTKKKEIELAHGVAFYQEGNKDKIEDMYFNDYLPSGNGKVTYADVARKIRKKIRLEDIDNVENDPYNRATNELNKETRNIVLSKLMELQEASKTGGVKKYRYGGKVTKYDNGGPNIDDIISGFKDQLGQIDDLNQSSYDQTVSQYNTLGNKLGALNAASLLANTMFVGAQKTRVDPAYSDSSMADSMFKSIAPAALQQRTESQRGLVNSLANQYLKSGADYNQTQAYITPLLDRVIGMEGDVGYRNLADTRDADRAKDTFRQGIINKNIAEGASAERATDSQVNQATALIGKGVDSFIDNLGQGAVDKVTTLRKALSEYNTTKLSNMMNRFSADMTASDFNMRKHELDTKRKMFEEAVKSGNNISVGMELDAPSFSRPNMSLTPNINTSIGLNKTRFDQSSSLGKGTLGFGNDPNRKFNRRRFLDFVGSNSGVFGGTSSPSEFDSTSNYYWDRVRELGKSIY